MSSNICPVVNKFLRLSWYYTLLTQISSSRFSPFLFWTKKQNPPTFSFLECMLKTSIHISISAKTSQCKWFKCHHVLDFENNCVALLLEEWHQIIGSSVCDQPLATEWLENPLQSWPGDKFGQGGNWTRLGNFEMAQMQIQIQIQIQMLNCPIRMGNFEMVPLWKKGSLCKMKE